MIQNIDLITWCRIPYKDLENHPKLKIPFRLVEDSHTMGFLLANELIEEIEKNNDNGEKTRAIIPCGPSCWYEPFTNLINEKNISLENLFIFHMDECLDWQGHLLPANHPYNFRRVMEHCFYNPIKNHLQVPEENRYWLSPNNIDDVLKEFYADPINICFGGWGQDGHIAYNQTRRHPYSQITLEELRNSSARIQENNFDTIIALGQRTFGGAYQFVPPMSVTLGVREIFTSKKIRLFSDTGPWKQTALRVALFSSPSTEYPISLLQDHDDVLLTATIDTATHPISENEDWDLGVSFL